MEIERKFLVPELPQGLERRTAATPPPARTRRRPTVEPSPARAWLLGLPSPGHVISGLLGGVGSAIGGTVGKLAVTGFDAIIHALFAPIAHFINTQLIGWLVAVPDYAPPGSHVAATERTVLTMAGAALGAVATISIARFWLAGLAGSGGWAFEGLARTVGAALLLPIWPWLFHARSRWPTPPAPGCWARGASRNQARTCWRSVSARASGWGSSASGCLSAS